MRKPVTIASKVQNVNYNTKLLDLLNDPERGISSSKNILTVLARKLMFVTDLRPMNYFSLTEKWLRRKFGRSEEELKKMSSHRGNFTKEFVNDAMTIGVFQKVTQMYGATTVTMRVRLEFDDGRPDVEVEAAFNNSVSIEENKDE